MDTKFEAALRACAMGNLAGARQICRAILIVEPEHREALIMLADLCQRGGDAEEAVEVCLHRLAIAPDDPRANFILGEAWLSQNCVAEAVQAFRVAADLAPRDGRCHARLAAALRRAEEDDAALASYARAIICKPAEQSHFLEFATFLITLGRDAEAIEVLDEATQLFPENPRLWWMLADRLRGSGRREAALGAYRRGTACRPRVFGVFFDYATLLLELGRAEAALDVARNAQAVEPDHPMAANLMRAILLGATSQTVHAH